MTDSRPSLVVVYGPPFSGTGEVGRAIARVLPPRSAVLSVNALLEAIAVPWEDAAAELDMVHQQVRLLTAHYLKHGYSLVVDGPFLFERDGRLFDYQSHIDQLLALMRNLVSARSIIRLEISDEAIRARAAAPPPTVDSASSLRTSAAYRTRSGPDVLTFNAAAHSPTEIAAVVLQDLRGGTGVGGG